MRKIIISDILVILTTLLMLLGNIVFAKPISKLTRNFLFSTKKDAYLLKKNDDVNCIDDSFSSDSPVFVKRDYETYSNNAYLCLIEFILNNGEVYSFSFSGTTDDDHYRGLNNLSNITLLCQNNIQSSSFVKKLTFDEIEKLSNSLDGVNDTQSLEYAVIDGQDSSHNIDIWGFNHPNNSLILYYSYKNNIASVSTDENAQQILTELSRLLD